MLKNIFKKVDIKKSALAYDSGKSVWPNFYTFK
jgi:hypothetical protein